MAGSWSSVGEGRQGWVAAGDARCPIAPLGRLDAKEAHSWVHSGVAVAARVNRIGRPAREIPKSLQGRRVAEALRQEPRAVYRAKA